LIRGFIDCDKNARWLPSTSAPPEGAERIGERWGKHRCAPTSPSRADGAGAFLSPQLGGEEQYALAISGEHMPLVDAGGHRLEFARIAGDANRPTLIFLHEGLGSLAMWRDFPAKLAQATGAPAVVYSRLGYGRSDRLTAPRGVRYMHDEALVTLPGLRQVLGLDDVILIGHSDCASIALIHAGSGRWPVRGLILEAPHVFVEDASLASIEAARIAYETTDLSQRLARYHADVDSAFRGWNDIWLHPDFRAWNIEDYLPGVACPVLAIQGADDEYGTLAQIEAIEHGIGGVVERLVLVRCKHSPHRDQEQAVLAAMAGFVARLV
jgi:pimeloyl-ACP methyl ester carboxylesterase